MDMQLEHLSLVDDAPASLDFNGDWELLRKYIHARIDELVIDCKLASLFQWKQVVKKFRLEDDTEAKKERVRIVVQSDLHYDSKVVLLINEVAGITKTKRYKDHITAWVNPSYYYNSVHRYWVRKDIEKVINTFKATGSTITYTILPNV